MVSRSHSPTSPESEDPEITRRREILESIKITPQGCVENLHEILEAIRALLDPKRREILREPPYYPRSPKKGSITRQYGLLTAGSYPLDIEFEPHVIVTQAPDAVIVSIRAGIGSISGIYRKNQPGYQLETININTNTSATSNGT